MRLENGTSQKPQDELLFGRLVGVPVESYQMDTKHGRVIFHTHWRYITAINITIKRTNAQITDVHGKQ